MTALSTSLGILNSLWSVCVSHGTYGAYDDHLSVIMVAGGVSPLRELQFCRHVEAWAPWSHVARLSSLTSLSL